MNPCTYGMVGVEPKAGAKCPCWYAPVKGGAVAKFPIPGMEVPGMLKALEGPVWASGAAVCPCGADCGFP